MELDSLSSRNRALIDSCLGEFHKVQDDTSKLNAINIITKSSLDYRLKLSYHQWVFDFVENKIKSSSNTQETSTLKNKQAVESNNIALIHGRTGNVDLALEYFNRSLAIYKESDEILGMGQVINNIAMIQFGQGEIDSALTLHMEALTILLKTQDQKSIAGVYHSVGYCYFYLSKIPLALEYYSKSLKIREEDCLYTFTDGFQDQFGGSNGKKYMNKRMKKLLLEVSSKPANEQHDLLNTEFEDWVRSGKTEQIDDVCIVGLKN